MKAIKHIRAGLVNIEVIGQVPDYDTKRRRAGRSRPTCAAQAFYNNKTSWRELELRIAANFGASDIVLTLTYGDDKLPADKRAAETQLYRFLRRLREVRRKRDEELLYVYCTEGYHGKASSALFGEDGALEDKRLHHHMVINRVSPGDLEEIRSLWTGGGYIHAEALDVHYYEDLAKYMTKEAREYGRAKPGEQTWKASRNLKHYEVEYIEIPSDSITLTPPPGAVDYRSFSEANPYGYAANTGARYLLFPAAERADYFYNKGRYKND